MKLKTFAIGIVLLALIGCASVHRDDPVEIYQKTRSYKNRSFGVVWLAALRAVDEIGFVVRKATKNVGLIHAGVKKNPDPQFLPPRMNVVIRESEGRIEVNFHIELPGQRNNKGIRRSFANQFFKALRKNL